MQKDDNVIKSLAMAMASSKYNTHMVATLSAHISAGRHLSNKTTCRHRSTKRLSDQRRHFNSGIIRLPEGGKHHFREMLSDNSTIGGLNRTDIINGTEPSNWYDYWSSTSKPIMNPTPQPSNKPTTVPSHESFESTPTLAPTQFLNKRASSSNNQNYEIMSSMTVLFFLVFIAVAFYVTKRYFLKKRKVKSKVMIASPFFCHLSRRVKERRKLMEDYFEVDAAEWGMMHRSAASSVDLQISTEFINISSANQQ